ncbi:MAG: hypothetical protein HY458_01840 [Parcubacteria group bacterium]|nr:hypothetical protein [Parcubacteria group bacterium]
MAATTQEFLELDEIREGMAVLKDRTVRGVMLVSSQNFALKSGEEQDATIAQFQSLLNSLDFSMQIVVQSRRLNLTGYLDQLKELEVNQKNELLKGLTKDYHAFVERLIAGSAIMTKNFFVVVPFSLVETLPLDDRKRMPRIVGGLSDDDLQRMKTQLWQRMEFVALGLRRMGLKVAPLNSEELIELFWGWHHPKEAEVGYYPEIPPEIIR